MTQLKESATHQKFQPRDPATWGSVDTWIDVGSFKCGLAVQTADQRIRAGRDSMERTARVWYRSGIKNKPGPGSQLTINGEKWEVISLDESTGGGQVTYCDVKAVQG